MGCSKSAHVAVVGTLAILTAVVSVTTSIVSVVIDDYLYYTIINLVLSVIAAGYLLFAGTYVLMKKTCWVTQTCGLISAFFGGICMGYVTVQFFGAQDHRELTVMYSLSSFLTCMMSGLVSTLNLLLINKHSTTHRFNCFIAVVYILGLLTLGFSVPSLNDFTPRGQTSWLGMLCGLLILLLLYPQYRYSKWSTVSLLTLSVIFFLLIILEVILLATGNIEDSKDAVFDIITRSWLIFASCVCVVYKVYFLPEGKRPVPSDSLTTAASGLGEVPKEGREDAFAESEHCPADPVEV